MRYVVVSAGVLMAALAIGCGPGGSMDATPEGGGSDGGGTDGPVGTDTGGGRDASEAGRDAAADAGPSRAGFPCTDDTMCNGLMCDTSVPGGLCTGMCSEGSATSEASMCGGRGSTCLTADPGGPMERSFCTRACTVSLTAMCGENQACTSLPNTRSVMGAMETPGCLFFCHNDMQCPSGQHCNRAGACQAMAPNLTLRPDGEACNPMTESMAGMPSNQCRGRCLRAGTQATQGICGSFIDIARPPRMNADGGPACPDTDRNDVVVPRGADGIGLCVWRDCACDSQCPTGMRCLDARGDGTIQICTYPNPMAMPPEVYVTMCPAADGGTDGGGSDAAADATTTDVASGG